MSRRQKDPLRALTVEERTTLERVSRAQSAPDVQVAHAKLLLAVTDGKSYTAAALSVGRRSNDAVAHLVSRFNQTGLAVLELQHSGGPAIIYGATERERILREFHRSPDREQDGTATMARQRGQRPRCNAHCDVPQTILRVSLPLPSWLCSTTLA